MCLKRPSLRSLPFLFVLCLTNCLKIGQAAPEVSCGKGENLLPPSFSTMVGAVSSWQQTNSSGLEPITHHPQSRSSGRLSIFTFDKDKNPIGSYLCNGSAVGEDIVLTNYHCLYALNKNRAVSFYKILADFDSDASGATTKRFDCSQSLLYSSDLDYAVLQCSGHPGLQVGSAGVSVGDSGLIGKNLNIFYYNCPVSTPLGECSANIRKREITIVPDAKLEGVETRMDGAFFNLDKEAYSFRTPVRGGTSGAGVRRPSDGRLVGIINSGSSKTSRFIPMDAILRDIRKKSPELRKLFDGYPRPPQSTPEEKIKLSAEESYLLFPAPKLNRDSWTHDFSANQ